MSSVAKMDISTPTLSDSYQSNQLAYRYGDPSDILEIQGQHNTQEIGGQGTFFHLVTSLDVPVLARSANPSGGRDFVFAGAGTSYGVTRPLLRMTPGLDTIKNLESTVDAIRYLERERFVIKRIFAVKSQVMTDQKQLAAITNEVRILSCKSLANSPNIVKLLCVAWDEIPSNGRYWPRLLLESADEGNLKEFLQSPGDSRLWNTKVSVLVDVLSGLGWLKGHKIAHCDLKLENTLVFSTSQPNQFGVDHKAKICDFGFSVVLSDYEDDAIFCARGGTHPWNAPELAFGKEIRISQLFKADQYSFGLLATRVFINGENPFQGLTDTEINSFKGEEEESYMNLCQCLMNAIEQKSQYTINQRIIISFLLNELVHPLPDQRWAFEKTYIRLLHSLVQLIDIGEMIVPGDLYTDLTVTNEVTSEEDRDSRNMRRLFELVDPRIFSEDSTDTFEVIPKLPTSEAKEAKAVDDIVNFERGQNFTGSLLPVGIASELLRSLKDEADRTTPLYSKRSAEACYQLSIAYCDGIGVAPDAQECLEWMRKACLLGSIKAIGSISNIYASFDKPLPKDIIEIRSKRLRDSAEFCLWESFGHACRNEIGLLHNFSHISELASEQPNQYLDLIEGLPYGVFRVNAMFTWLLEEIIDMPYAKVAGSSFKSLKGFNPTSQEPFMNGNSEQFLNEVKEKGWISKVDNSLLTLLQISALRGELSFTKTLVNELEAEVDDAGVTLGMTPLWLSVFAGNIDIARFLISKGANPRCRDGWFGRSILHFLNKCRSMDDILFIVEQAFRSRIHLESRDYSGLTPLQATFVGWDYSFGKAAHLLLKLGAKLSVFSQKKRRPLTVASGRLDLSLMRKTFTRHKQLDRKKRRSRKSSRIRIMIGKNDSRFRRLSSSSSTSKAKAEALLVVMQKSPFSCRRKGGAEFSNLLQATFKLLLSPDSTREFSKHPVSQGTNVLASACFMGNQELASAILKCKHCPDLGTLDSQGLSVLHWAAERNLYNTFIELLVHGADPLQKSRKKGPGQGGNAFHRAATFAPDLLLRVLEEIEAEKLPKPKDLSIRDILHIRNGEGHSVFDLAIIEGTSDHLRVAEILRTRYKLSYDKLSIPFVSGTKETLLAYIIRLSVTFNNVELEQVEYLFNMQPPPRFLASTDGSTLLHQAVQGWNHVDTSSNPVGYYILERLLRTFPGRKYLEIQDNRGQTVLHYISRCSNITALELIIESLAARREILNVNIGDDNGHTALDSLGTLAKILMTLDESKSKALESIVKRNSVMTYSWLRSFGAKYSHELTSKRWNSSIPIMIVSRIQAELEEDTLIEYLQDVNIEFNLTTDILDLESPDVFETSDQRVWVVELVWHMDNFAIVVRTVSEDVYSAYVEHRIAFRRKVTQQGAILPWLSKDVLENVTDDYRTAENQVLRYIRPGSRWTSEEVTRLAAAIGMKWSQIFKSQGSTENDKVEPEQNT